MPRMAKKILIKAPMRRNIALMLELEGYQTCVAENGRIGVEVARRELPDLVLCDVMMPEMDGYTVFQTLRAEEAFADTPFIFLTARADHHDVRIGMNFGGDASCVVAQITSQNPSSATTSSRRCRPASPAPTRCASGSWKSAASTPTTRAPTSFSKASASPRGRPKCSSGLPRARRTPRSPSSSA